MASRATMTLIGEAGPEAVVPLKGGAILAKLTAKGLQALMPSGQTVPIKLPQLALGGVVGQPLAPSSPAVLHTPVLGDGTPGGRQQAITVNFNVTSPDAAGFRASESQTGPTHH